VLSKSDQEYYNTYLSARSLFLKDGWEESKPRRDKRTLSVMFKKNGYSMFLLFGCDEDVKNELL